MHQDPWEPPDGPYPSDRTPDSDSSNAEPPADGEITRISPLLNWQVIEIDGEATLIEETEIKEAAIESVSVASSALVQEVAPPPTETRTPSSIREQVNDIVFASMALRRVVVVPGEVVEFEVSVANQGRWSALFEVTVEGWIDEAWVPDLPLRVQMEPGARRVVTLTIAPPRQANCHAGEHALAVVIRASRYPGHWTRLPATLVVERFAALKLGTLQPREVDLSWFVPSATMRLPITNQSNYPATVHLQGIDRGRQCDFTFYTDGSGVDDGIMGTAHLTLQPGQTVSVPVEVRTRQRPLMGLVPRMTPFRLVARVDTEPPLRRAIDGQLSVAALVGLWQMAIAGILGVVAIFGTGLAGLALLVALRSSSFVNNGPSATPVAAAPVVALVIQMDQPMPTRVPDLPTAPLSAPSQIVPQVAAQGAPNVGNGSPVIPIVSADQVTAPGEPTPVGQRQLQPIVVTTPSADLPIAQNSVAQGSVAQGSVAQGQVPQASAAEAAPAQANGADLTYGQMFQQVASQFDLDWRMLAAQAYLESGFDSLALSGQGDMGLMQIRPGTWNEWAPTVDASDPFDSYSNVLVGAAYLNHLREMLSAKGQHDPGWMLVAYNWGPEKVSSHLEAGGTWETLDPERRQYSEDILRIAASIPLP